MIRSSLLAMVALLLTVSVHADNGAISYATVMQPIVVDGKLDDWPADLPRYPVQLDGDRTAIAPSDDFNASFRIGYDADGSRLFIALEVVDDVHITDDSGVVDDWSAFDSVIAYVDFEHSPNGSGAGLYLVSDAHRSMLTDEHHWDAAVAEASWEQQTAAVARLGDRTIYEFALTSTNPLTANRVLGLDFLIADVDDATQASGTDLYAWGPGFGKSQAGGRIGDVLLLGDDRELGILSGQIDVEAPATDSQDRRLRVRIRATDNPALWVQTQADEDGGYKVELPPGAYEVSNVERLIWDGDTPQVVAPASPVTVQLNAKQRTDAPRLSLTPARMPIALPARGALFDFQAKDSAALDVVIESLMAYYQVPGLSLALVKDGRLAYHGTYGLQNAYSGIAVADDTVFEAASITKAVFAFAVNRMADRGEIDLDRPLYTYLPFEDIAHDERYKKITARHVLSHQSGFPNWRWQNPDGQLDIKFYPGIQYGYSGEGFEYLGRVVATIADAPLVDVVRRETLDVMGFDEATFFFDTPELYEVAARGHLAGMTGPFGFPSEIGVAHSMYTEARSFSNFMLALLAGKGLSSTGYAQMLEPQVAIPLEPEDTPQWPGRYGLGFHLMNTPFGLAYGHGGFNGDFSCQFELYPEHDMGFAVFTNADTGWLLVNTLREYLVIGMPEVE
ncbi:MAG: serine hydrolase [Pseudomonadota bacterium]